MQSMQAQKEQLKELLMFHLKLIPKISLEAYFVPVRLTVNNLANVDINVNGSWLSTNPNVPTDLGFKYIAKAYDLEAYAKDSKYGITSFIVMA